MDDHWRVITRTGSGYHRLNLWPRLDLRLTSFSTTTRNLKNKKWLQDQFIDYIVDVGLWSVQAMPGFFVVQLLPTFEGDCSLYRKTEPHWRLILSARSLQLSNRFAVCLIVWFELPVAWLVPDWYEASVGNLLRGIPAAETVVSFGWDGGFLHF